MEISGEITGNINKMIGYGGRLNQASIFMKIVLSVRAYSHCVLVKKIAVPGLRGQNRKSG